MGTCTFNVRVVDFEAPTFPNCPGPITANTDSARCTANVETLINAPVTLVADDNCGVVSTITNHPVDANFPVGVTNFVATAADAEDTTGTCRFTITIVDNEAPTITCPGTISVTTTKSSENISFNPSTFDNCLSNIATTCNPPSNSRFNAGTTTVTCEAIDVTNPTQFGTCSFDVIVNQIPAGNSASQTPNELPSQSPSNSPTRGLISPQISRDQVSPSESFTGTRSNNPSVSSTASPSISASPTVSDSNTPSSSPSNSPIPSSSPSNSPSRTRSPIVSSQTRSPFIPSQSPSSTPVAAIALFEQVGTTTLVEVILNCDGGSCTRAEAQFYIDAFAVALGIDVSNVYLEAIFGDEVTFIVCNSDDVADLLNDINFGDAPPELAGSFVESAIFEVACPGDFQPQEQQESSNDASAFSAGLIFLSIVTLFF